MSRKKVVTSIRVYSRKHVRPHARPCTPTCTPSRGEKEEKTHKYLNIYLIFGYFLGKMRIFLGKKAEIYLNNMGIFGQKRPNQVNKGYFSKMYIYPNFINVHFLTEGGSSPASRRGMYIYPNFINVQITTTA